MPFGDAEDIGRIALGNQLGSLTDAINRLPSMDHNEVVRSVAIVAASIYCGAEMQAYKTATQYDPLMIAKQFMNFIVFGPMPMKIENH